MVAGRVHFELNGYCATCGGAPCALKSQPGSPTNLGLVFGETEAIVAAIHLRRCYWAHIGSPVCKGPSAADRREAAEFLALRDLLAVTPVPTSAGKEDLMSKTSRGTRIG